MARIETTTRTLYKFEELSDDAKENARDWWRDCENQDSDNSCIYAAAATIAELFGLDICQTRKQTGDGSAVYLPTIYYSGFSSQGDGACFEGRYEYKKGGLRAVKEYAPKDKDLHQIVEDLQTAQKPYFYKLTASTKHSGYYYHSGCMSIDVEGDRDIFYDDFTPAENSITDALRSFADWIYQQLESDYDWRMSDEQVDESIICNEYEFDKEGGFA